MPGLGIWSPVLWWAWMSRLRPFGWCATVAAMHSTQVSVLGAVQRCKAMLVMPSIHRTWTGGRLGASTGLTRSNQCMRERCESANEARPSFHIGVAVSLTLLV